MLIPLTKRVSFSVEHGHIQLRKTNDGNTYEVYYHNDLYVGSPFKHTVSFSTDFTVSEVVNSSEVIRFVKQITGETFEKHHP